MLLHKLLTLIRPMLGKKKLALLFLVLGAMMGISAVELTKVEHVNLKVLPKDISDQKLDKIMLDDFEKGLGVTCNYCHVEDKAAKKFDYASDAIPEKETAREMMRMTLELNKTYFKLGTPALGDSTLVVTCYTCHNGNAIPKVHK